MNKGRLLIILCTLALGFLLATQAEAAKRQLTKQEEYVLEQAAVGGVADLKARFGENEETRILSARFLEDLLTNAFETENSRTAVFLQDRSAGKFKCKVHRKGVWIEDAIITEELDLKSAEVPFEVKLINCVFREKVNFQDSLFGKNLRMDECNFAKEANFLKMTVKKSAYFKDAVFNGQAVFNGIDIGGSMNMDDTEFTPETAPSISTECIPLEPCEPFVVNFNSSIIGSYFSLRNATIEGPAKFVALKVRYDLYLNGATIQQADFCGADIGHDFIGRKGEKRRTSFLGPSSGSPDEEKNYAAMFLDMKVGHVADFEDAIFEDKVDFSDSTIGAYLSLRGVKITGPAKFKDMKVGSDFYLEKTRIFGSAEFTRSDIKRDLIAEETWFLGLDYPTEKEIYAAIFPDMKVGRVMNIEKAIFLGEVNLSRVKVGLELKADKARFQNVELSLSAIELKVNTIAYFRDAVFLGPANFTGSDIRGQFNASRASFQSAIFSGMKVGELVQLTDVKFRGPVKFDRAEVGGDLITEVETYEEKEGAIIRGYFGGENELSFTDARITNLILQGTDNIPFYINRLNLKGLCVDKDLNLESTEVDNLEAVSLNVIGQATFKNTIIKKGADLSYSKFGTLKINMNIDNWPKYMESENEEDDNKLTKEAGLILDGLEYKDLLPRETSEDRGKLNAWIIRSRFDVENYIGLEKYFANLGYEKDADEVYMSMKGQELAKMAWYSPGRWLIWFFWGKLTGYGRHPFRIFWLGLFIITLGAIFMFDPKYLKLDVMPTWHLNYKMRMRDLFKKDNYYKYFIIKNLGKLYVLRFITSFDQFIPAIDLGVTKNWQPKELSFWSWFYVYFQKISGWILVPIGLAAIYSQFR